MELSSVKAPPSGAQEEWNRTAAASDTEKDGKTETVS